MNEIISIFHHGNIKHKPIVFVHGFPFDNHMWKYQVEFFSREYFCITYDLRGLGSTPSGEGQFTIEDLTDDLESVIERSQIRKPILCGLSMGGI